MASIGGILGLFLSGEYLSVPASVGFIALWGIAVLNGVVLVSYIRKLREEGLTQANAIREGTRLRFRPVMMTATVAALGLVPFLFATGPGSEIQRPLAIVVIGGLVSSTALTLLLLPVVYAAFEGKGAIPSRLLCGSLARTPRKPFQPHPIAVCPQIQHTLTITFTVGFLHFKEDG